MGLLVPRCTAVFFSLLELKGSVFAALSSPLSYPQETIQGINYCSQFCLICELTEGGLFPWPESFMNMSNSADPSINLWGRNTDLQLDFVPLTTNAWTHQQRRLSIYLTVLLTIVYTSSVYISKIKNNNIKILLPKVKINHICHSHPPKLSFHCRNLISLVKCEFCFMNYTDYSQWPSCSLCIWKLFAGLSVSLSLSQRSRWNWSMYSFLNLLSDPPWR